MGPLPPIPLGPIFTLAMIGLGFLALTVATAIGWGGWHLFWALAEYNGWFKP